MADADNNRVLRFNAPLTTDPVADAVFGQNGSFTTNQRNQPLDAVQLQSGPTQGSLRQPVALGRTADGDLFVVDSGNNRVLGFRAVGSPRINANIYLPTVIK